MNTRVQVEHCVTEETTGVDIVREQILIAAGEELSFTQEDVRWHGHAIECRINAEDAAKNFARAAAGHFSRPDPGVRIDSGVLAGSEITPLYDPMVAKLIVWDADRDKATRRMLRALDEFQIEGVRTLIPFHKAIMASDQWANAETCRDLIEDKAWLKQLAQPKPEPPAEEAEKVEREYLVEVSGKRFDVRVMGEAFANNGAGPPRARPAAERKSGGGTGASGDALTRRQGNIFKLLVEQGAEVEEGALICIIEAMKMENEITAHKAGTVAEPDLRGRRRRQRRHARRDPLTDELDALIHEAAEWLRIPDLGRRAQRGRAARGGHLGAAARAGRRRDLRSRRHARRRAAGRRRAARPRRRADRSHLRPLRRPGPGDESAWTTPPFEPDIRDGRLYARGACDDKGNFLPLLHVARALADAGELPVNVRVLVEGAEETGSDDVNHWVAADERGADCVIAFDAGMLDPETPALTVGTRDGVREHGAPRRRAARALRPLRRRGAERLPRPARRPCGGPARPRRPPAGGAARRDPAAHAGRARDVGRAAGGRRRARRGGRAARRSDRGGRVPHAHDGRRGARRAPDLRRRGAYDRAAVASCDSVRLAPGQTRRRSPGRSRRWCAPPSPEPSSSLDDPRLALAVRPRARRCRIARGALARVCGREPVLLRSGGTLPILASFADRGIPAIVSGFGCRRTTSTPDESFTLAGLELGRRAARRCTRTSVRVWRAAPEEAPAVAALLGGFRDHLGYSTPDDASIRRSVERIIGRDDAEYLLAGEDEAQAVAQVRYRWSVVGRRGLLARGPLRPRRCPRQGARPCAHRPCSSALARGCRRVELDVNSENLPPWRSTARSDSTPARRAARTF